MIWPYLPHDGNSGSTDSPQEPSTSSSHTANLDHETALVANNPATQFIGRFQHNVHCIDIAH
jgi:hypothetical protein